MRVHFIAIGGSAMHNMAIALHKKGLVVSGSDDEIFEPSRSRLKQYGLLPKKEGWNPAEITSDLDAVILGMHAKADNPELLKAMELGIKIYSYPEYVYEQAKEQKRIVIGGSHGKTSITSMILHVLKSLGKEFDYLVGAQLEGFETMVQFSDAPIMVIEGDEYLSSPIDKRPKFLWYKPHVAVISGIAWDHINVFPTFDLYVDQFRQFISSIEASGILFYYEGDQELNKILGKQNQVEAVPYKAHPSKVENESTYLKVNESYVPIEIFGEHNLQNLSAALLVCKQIGVSEDEFYTAIQHFNGAARRLELIAKSDSAIVYKDFAHSPSKLKATTEAVKKQYKDKRLLACMELHTFSSLNKDFLQEYSGSMNKADEAVIYFNPKTIAHKGLTPITKEEVRQAFLPSEVKVLDDSTAIKSFLEGQQLDNTVLLLMTSGNFDGINLDELGKQLAEK